MNPGPRVIRPRSDSALWPLTAVGTLIALGVGYVGGLRVFRPPPSHADTTGEGEGDTLVLDASVDASTEAAVAVAPVIVDVPIVEPPRAPSVPVRMERTILQSCGEGDELATLGPRCSITDGLEDLLRKHLLDEIGRCPSAVAAAKKPSSLLSIGLRIDFTHRRVAALPGKSSTVESALTFVPCARDAVANVPELWKLQAAHPRYLYFFQMHFGPLPADWGTQTATTPVAPEPVPVVNEPSPLDAGTPVATNEPQTNTASPNPTPPSNGMLQGTADGGVTFSYYEVSHPHDVTVVWDRAIIRDAPNGPTVLARFIKGAPLRVTHRSGSWFLVHWRSGQGWVFKDAIGEQ